MADRRNSYKYAWEGDTAYDGPIEPGMWVLWAGHGGIGYYAGKVLKPYPANIRLEPAAASDWRYECRRQAIRAVFQTEAEAMEIVTALDKLAKLQPFGVFQGDMAPGRYQRLLAEARRHGFLPEPEADTIAECATSTVSDRVRELS